MTGRCAPEGLGFIFSFSTAGLLFVLPVGFGEAMRASDLATISPAHVFAREIASGEFSAVRIVRPAIEQTTWMSFGAHRALSAAAQIVTRQIRKLAAQRRKPGPAKR